MVVNPRRRIQVSPTHRSSKDSQHKPRDNRDCIKSAVSAKHLVFNKSEMWSETVHVTNDTPLYFSFGDILHPGAFVAVVLSTPLTSHTVKCSVSGSSHRFHAQS